MRIVLPSIEIAEDSGFDPKIDIFKRAGFGERLGNLIANADDNPVIALDSGWGEGKSTFIKMWRGYLSHHREERIESIYFDAFENDYQKDPFLTLASEIYQLIPSENKEKQSEFRDKATKAVKSLARGALKLTVRTATAGIIDGNVVDSAEQGISNLVADQVDDLVKDKFKHAEKDKFALKEFKDHLSEFANEMSGGKPIVFIIDELDRCRPDFALKLLEQVKHLFSVKGITFLLVTNRSQLEESIKTEYGQDIDPTNYLHKFINVWLTMPRLSDEYNDHGYQFLHYALNTLKNSDEQIVNQETIEVFNDIVKYYQPSFREIERILSYFSIINNMSGDTRYYANYQYMIAIVCYLKACKPNSLLLINGKLDYDKIIRDTKLDTIEGDHRFYSLMYLKKLIRFDLGNEDIRNAMIADGSIKQDSFGRSPKNIMITIISWLSEVSKG